MSRLENARPECPICHEILDGYTAVFDPGSVPQEGDVTVCGYCLTPLEYIDGMNLRVLDMNKLEGVTLREMRLAIRYATEIRDMRRRMN